MKITHANKHQWVKYITADCLQNYGKSDKKRITKALDSLAEHNIEYRFEIANDVFFDWFTPLYTSSLLAKNSDAIYDVKAATVGKPNTILIHKTLTVLQDGVPVGGCIFSTWKDRYSIAFRMFRPSWSTPLRIASPALLGEYFLDQYSFENNKKLLIHGEDRNPYGIHSAIGVANFKLAVGCYPQLPVTYTTVETDTDNLAQDTLLLHLPNSGKRITESTLVITTNSTTQYDQLRSYQDRINIHTYNLT